jgi:hypothetical protein
MIANGDELFAEEEHALLLVRLRAVAFLLSAGLTLVLVREELFGGGPGWPLQAAAMVAMMFLATLLRAARSGWERGLKVVEAAAFGLAAGVVAVHLWHAQLSGTARGDAASLAAASKDAVIGTTIVLFTYALLIPAGNGPLRLRVGQRLGCPEGGQLVGGVRAGAAGFSGHRLKTYFGRACARSGGSAPTRCHLGDGIRRTGALGGAGWACGGEWSGSGMSGGIAASGTSAPVAGGRLSGVPGLSSEGSGLRNRGPDRSGVRSSSASKHDWSPP